MICLEAPRLLIRDHLESDLADLHVLLSDPEAMRYLPDIHCASLAQSMENLRTALQETHRSDRTKYYLAVLEKDSGTYVGEVGVTIVACGLGQLGYFVLRKHWGKGYVTEAAQALLAYSFGTLGLHKISSGCLLENAASERVMIRCGMRKEAHLRAHVWHEGAWKDRVEYGVLRQEWAAPSPRSRDRWGGCGEQAPP